MSAANGGLIKPMKLLIAAGADVNAMNIVGETALYLAAELGQVAAVERLLAAEADPTIASTGPTAASRRGGIKGVAPAGTTPLAIAEKNGHAAVVRILTTS
jgi:ankyrin repeat protein